MPPLLELDALSVRFRTPHGVVEAVRGVSLAMGREKVALVGESGSGKSVTARAILGLVRPPGEVTARSLRFDGEDLLGRGPRAWRRVRGRRIAMVLQDPKFSLNPVLTVGEQVAEAYRAHFPVSRREARVRALARLVEVRIRDPEWVYDLYPHQVSGGMGQRIMLAMMLAPEPDLLIADEPTSALDVTVQTQVLAIVDRLVSERGMGLLFISHDLTLVRSFCDRVLVMYRGRLVEECRAGELDAARHPYTRGLLECVPQLDRPRETLPVLQRDEAWGR